MKLDEWRFSFEIAWDDPWYRWQTIVTVVSAFAGSAWLLWKLIPEGLRSGLLVFHYNPYFGIDAVLPWYDAFSFVGIALAIILADAVLSFRLFRHDRIASRVLLCASTVFAALLLVAASMIVSVNV